MEADEHFRSGELDLVRCARNSWNESTLLIDTECVYDARKAFRRVNAFAEYHPEWFEEPLREDDIEGYVWLRDRSPILNAAGKGESSWQRFRLFKNQETLYG